LKGYQKQIDDLTNYAERVAQVKKLWKPQNRTFDDVAATLVKMCPGTRRCCYCEDGRGDDIEHFRPKMLYPELTFVWTNYLLACSACNSNSKREQFSVIDSSGQLHDVTRKKDKSEPIVAPLEGDPALINPRYENPLDYLRINLTTFEFYARKGLSERDQKRAEYTIKILGLNVRSELQDWRKTAFSNFVGWMDTYRRHKNSEDSSALRDHTEKLKRQNHLAVWEEMKRVYRERNLARWGGLTRKYFNYHELERLFSEFPELLDVSV
jgi:uncharacterized protein (TIGR02646 family)